LTREEVAEIEQAPVIGVLSYQGDVREHLAAVEAAGARAVPVKLPGQLAGLAGLIIPGGESTTIGKLMTHFGMDRAIRERYEQGMALFGTCAGLILMAREIEGSEQPRLGLMDITARRNAFGRQVQSFETDLEVPDLGGGPLRAVFIRAPYISSAGEGVHVMASFNDRIVLARQGRLLAAAFHPELVGETRLHHYFLDIATGKV
jgi:5'-phosphate synthase pdxT subunit